MSRGVGPFACCRLGEKGAWQTQLVIAAVAESGGANGSDVGSAHAPLPGVQPVVDVDGIGVGGVHFDLALAPVAGGVVVAAEVLHVVTLTMSSRSHSL